MRECSLELVDWVDFPKMSSFVEDKAVEEREEKPEEEDEEFAGLPEDEPEASDSGDASGSDGSSDDDEVKSDGFYLQI